jgi:hypothetical protein
MLINSMKTICFQSAGNVISCKEWENSTDSIFGVVGVELESVYSLFCDRGDQ